MDSGDILNIHYKKNSEVRSVRKDKGIITINVQCKLMGSGGGGGGGGG